jgi:ElaB/YqjD/DUF883 family membrane-anchored ribosome-binding protein
MVWLSCNDANIVVFLRFVKFFSSRTAVALKTAEIVHECTDIVKEGLRPFVEDRMLEAFGQTAQIHDSFHAGGKPHWDLQALLRTMVDNWSTAFDQSLPRDARSLVFELKDWRNRVAHEHNITLDDAYRMVDTATRLLAFIGSEETDKLRELRRRVMQAMAKDNEQTTSPQREPVSRTATRPYGDRKPLRTESSAQTTADETAGAPNWQACVNIVGVNLGVVFATKRGRCAFAADGKTSVCCVVSKEYPGKKFWYTIYERQLSQLAQNETAFVAFACGSETKIFVIPCANLTTLLPTLNPTTVGDKSGWHVHILNDGRDWWLLQSGRNQRINLTKFLV